MAATLSRYSAVNLSIRLVPQGKARFGDFIDAGQSGWQGRDIMPG